MLSFEERHVWMIGPARPPRTAADVLRALPGLVEIIAPGPAVLAVEGVGMEPSLIQFLQARALDPEDGPELEPGSDDPRAWLLRMPLSDEITGRIAWALTLAGPDAAGQSLQVYSAGPSPLLLVQWHGFPEEPLLVPGSADEEALAAWGVPLKCAVERVELR